MQLKQFFSYASTHLLSHTKLATGCYVWPLHMRRCEEWRDLSSPVQRGCYNWRPIVLWLLQAAVAAQVQALAVAAGQLAWADVVRYAQAPFGDRLALHALPTHRAFAAAFLTRALQVPCSLRVSGLL